MGTLPPNPGSVIVFILSNTAVENEPISLMCPCYEKASVTIVYLLSCSFSDKLQFFL
jgi:hypothetical protein